MAFWEGRTRHILKKSYQSPIHEYALAFFDRYLKGTTNPDALAHLLDPPWPKTSAIFGMR